MDLLSDLACAYPALLRIDRNLCERPDGREESRVLRLLGIDLIGAAKPSTAK